MGRKLPKALLARQVQPKEADPRGQKKNTLLSVSSRGGKGRDKTGKPRALNGEKKAGDDPEILLTKKEEGKKNPGAGLAKNGKRRHWGRVRAQKKRTFCLARTRFPQRRRCSKTEKRKGRAGFIFGGKKVVVKEKVLVGSNGGEKGIRKNKTFRRGGKVLSAARRKRVPRRFAKREGPKKRVKGR